MTDDLQKAGIATLISRYAVAAAKHGRASEDGRPDDANAAFESLALAYRELRRRGPEAQRQLAPLLADRDAFVRAWAAAHALEFDPKAGEAVLRDLADKDPGLAGLDAKITLREWLAGRLRFP